MNKIKIMFTGFAIFASILMLTTTCIARPVQENVNIEAIEYEKQELANVMDAMFLEMKSDCYLNSLIEMLSNDEELKSIARDIENIEGFDEKGALVSSFVDVLACKPEFSDGAAYIESHYSDDLQTIASQCNEFSSISVGKDRIETGFYYVAGVMTYGDDSEGDSGNEVNEVDNGDEGNTEVSMSIVGGYLLSQLIMIMMMLPYIILMTGAAILHTLAFIEWIIKKFGEDIQAFIDWIMGILSQYIET